MCSIKLKIERQKKKLLQPQYDAENNIDKKRKMALSLFFFFALIFMSLFFFLPSFFSTNVTLRHWSIDLMIDHTHISFFFSRPNSINMMILIIYDGNFLRVKCIFNLLVRFYLQLRICMYFFTKKTLLITGQLHLSLV